MKKLPIENSHLEYKQASSSVPKDCWETVSAFANTDGGVIILGITETKKNSEFIVSGVKNGNQLKIDFLNLQNDNTFISRPVVSDKDIEIAQLEGKEIVKIHVPKAYYKDRPIYLKGNIKKTFIRDHESDRIANSERLRYFIRESNAVTDSEALPNFDMDDIDIASLQSYQVLLSQINDDSSLLTNNFEQFLNSIGLLKRDRTSSNKSWNLTKAALLLFGKNTSIKEIFPYFFLDFVIKHNSSDTDYLDRIYTSNESGHPQNIYSFFDQTFQKIRSQINNTFELNGIQRKDSGDSLLIAIREGLVNTLVHSDYAFESQIKISLFNDYIEFYNPGEMRISYERFVLGGTSEARNPNIFSVFLRAKLGEHTGSGGHRIYQTADKLKLRTPEIKSNADSTQLIIWTIPLMESVIKTIPNEWKDTYIRLSTKLVASYSDVKDLYKSSYEGHKILNAMVDAKLLTKQGKNKGTVYLLAQDAPAIRQSLNKYIRQFQTEFLNQTKRH